MRLSRVGSVEPALFRGSLRDHGEDAWTGKPKTPDEWLGDGETCWHLKAGKAGTPAKVKGEVDKPLANSTLKRGGRFVLVASGSITGKMGEDARLKTLITEAEAAGLPTDRIAVFGSERLAAWVNQHPAIAAAWCDRPNKLTTLKDWAQQDKHQAPWQHHSSSREEIAFFRQALDPMNTSSAKDAGQLVLVVDSPTADLIRSLRDELDALDGRVRLITLDSDPLSEPWRGAELAIQPMPDENILQVAAFWYPTLPAKQGSFVAGIANGNPGIAYLACDALFKDPDLTLEELRSRLLKSSNRDFSMKVKMILSSRVGGSCSRPGCRSHTTDPYDDSNKVNNTFEATHITAATPGGPRYNPKLTPEQRSSADNGIWLCHYHHKLIDIEAATFPEALLREWKTWAEQEQCDRQLGITGGRSDWSWPAAWDFAPYPKERREGVPVQGSGRQSVTLSLLSP